MPIARSTHTMSIWAMMIWMPLNLGVMRSKASIGGSWINGAVRAEEAVGLEIAMMAVAKPNFCVWAGNGKCEVNQVSS